MVRSIRNGGHKSLGCGGMTESVVTPKYPYRRSGDDTFSCFAPPLKV